MCEKMPHGKMIVTGEQRFELPNSSFMIEPLPYDGPYSLMIESIRGNVKIPKEVATINANEWTKVKGLVPGTTIYISGVHNDVKFAVRW